MFETENHQTERPDRLRKSWISDIDCVLATRLFIWIDMYDLEFRSLRAGTPLALRHFHFTGQMALTVSASDLRIEVSSIQTCITSV